MSSVFSDEGERPVDAGSCMSISGSAAPIPALVCIATPSEIAVAPWGTGPDAGSDDAGGAADVEPEGTDAFAGRTGIEEARLFWLGKTVEERPGRCGGGAFL